MYTTRIVALPHLRYYQCHLQPLCNTFIELRVTIEIPASRSWRKFLQKHILSRKKENNMKALVTKIKQLGKSKKEQEVLWRRIVEVAVITTNAENTLKVFHDIKRMQGFTKLPYESS